MKKNLSSIMNGNYMINLRLIARIGRLHAIISSNGLNLLLTLCLLGICGLEQYVGYHTGLVAGAFYEVLLNKDLAGFTSAALRSLGVILGMALVKTIRMYNAKILSVFWRKTLTNKLHSHYFNKENYYRVNVLMAKLGLDNPDQRMTSDVDTFCVVYGEMIARLIISPFTIGYYAWDAYTRAGWIGPLGVFIYFVIGCLINLFLMSPVSQRVFSMEKNEGDFRFKHMFVREHAEEIAFANSARTEATNTNERLSHLISAQKSVYNWEILIDLWTNIYDYVGAILSYLIIAFPVFMNYYDSLDQAALGKQISQNSFVCMTLIYNLSQLVDLASKFANMAGVTHRMMELLEIMETPSHSGAQNPSVIIKNGNQREMDMSKADTLIEFSKVKLTTPDSSKRVLFEDLSLSIKSGSRILITGPSSSGKTSLLRCIRGLWPLEKGSIYLGTDRILYLSQNSLVCDGSLLDNMTYPSLSKLNMKLDWFQDQMKKFNLEHLANQFDITSKANHWEDILSPGEIQRLCFIRVFYHQPQLILLDESTSSLPSNDERTFYESLIEALPRATIISIGHRESLKAYHESEFCPQSDGKWELRNIVHST